MSLRERAANKVRDILIGIDQEDLEPKGWWETSNGAAFGGAKLAEIEEAVKSFIEEAHKLGEEGKPL